MANFALLRYKGIMNIFSTEKSIKDILMLKEL